jgi:hypothetical protein
VVASVEPALIMPRSESPDSGNEQGWRSLGQGHAPVVRPLPGDRRATAASWSKERAQHTNSTKKRAGAEERKALQANGAGKPGFCHTPPLG